MKGRKKIHKIKLSDILSKWNTSNLTPKQEKLRIIDNTTTIDNRLKSLATYVGRKLTEDEEEQILTIVDKLTPKKKDGNYLVDLLPFNYAWEIYMTKKDKELDKFMGKLEVDLSK